MGRKLHRVFAELREEISFLNGYHIAARYPNGLPDGIPATVFTGNLRKRRCERPKEPLILLKNYLMNETLK
jgi:hypothetical protein